MTDYGTKIAELRAANKMTQAQLGSMLSVTSQAVSKWENGLSEPDIESIKKMCEIFHITFDEFFGATPQQTTEQATDTEETSNEAKSTENTSVVLAYCDICDKPLYNPKEYQVSIVDGIQHTTCLKCIPKKVDAEIKQLETKAKAMEEARVRRRAIQKNDNWLQLRKGMLWGILGGVILAGIMLGIGIYEENTLICVLGSILGAYGGFAILTQMIWCNSVLDVMMFFIRSLKLPGIIFTLDIDGLIFFVVVKLLGAILSAIFSVIVFLFGFIITWIYAMVLFPFALIKEIREL